MVRFVVAAVSFCFVSSCARPASTPAGSAFARLAREADAKTPGALELAPPADPERDAIVQRSFGSRCRVERTCGPIWGIDCASAVDGPYVYVRPRPDRLEQLAMCGGACMDGRCTNCPPAKDGWTCSVY